MAGAADTQNRKRPATRDRGITDGFDDTARADGDSGRKNVRQSKPGEELMEPLTITEDIDQKGEETRRVREWRVEQLRSLGLPFILAESFADRIDWHALADLVDRGCPLHLAIDIVL